MSTEDLNKINQWTVDFAQAKIGLKNLEILVHSLTNDQVEVANRLSFIFDGYLKVLDQGESHVAKDQERITSLKKQLKTFAEIEQSLHASVTKFVGKCEAQLDSARTRVQTMSQNLSKLKAMKQPQHSAAMEQLLKQVPEFLTVFDSFMARFTLQVRWQQAEYYKKLAEAFTHVGQPEPIKEITDEWWAEFRQIMQAVEALKSVHAQPGFASAKTEDAINNSPTPHARMATESTDSLFSHSVKWISSKVGKEVKNFKFSDPRTGFFNKPTVPPKHSTEVVQAAFDFTGETDSDLPFTKGALITVIDKGTDDDPNWWCGELDGKRGLFPRNYVVEIDASSHPDEYIPKTTAGEKTSDQNSENPDGRNGEDDFGSFTDAQKPSDSPEQTTLVSPEESSAKALEGKSISKSGAAEPQDANNEEIAVKTPSHLAPDSATEIEHPPKLPSRDHHHHQIPVPDELTHKDSFSDPSAVDARPPSLPSRDHHHHQISVPETPSSEQSDTTHSGHTRRDHLPDSSAGDPQSPKLPSREHHHHQISVSDVSETPESSARDPQSPKLPSRDHHHHQISVSDVSETPESSARDPKSPKLPSREHHHHQISVSDVSETPESSARDPQSPKLPSRDHHHHQVPALNASQNLPPALPPRDKTSFEQIHNDSPSKSPLKSGSSNDVSRNEPELNSTQDKYRLDDPSTSSTEAPLNEPKTPTDNHEQHVKDAKEKTVTDPPAVLSSPDAQTPEVKAPADTKPISRTESSQAKTASEATPDVKSTPGTKLTETSQGENAEVASETKPTKLQQTPSHIPAMEEKDPIDELL